MSAAKRKTSFNRLGSRSVNLHAQFKIRLRQRIFTWYYFFELSGRCFPVQTRNHLKIQWWHISASKTNEQKKAHLWILVNLSLHSWWPSNRSQQSKNPKRALKEGSSLITGISSRPQEERSGRRDKLGHVRGANHRSTRTQRSRQNHHNVHADRFIPKNTRHSFCSERQFKTPPHSAPSVPCHNCARYKWQRMRSFQASL